MLPVLSRAQAREFDRAASATLGVPSIVLMENAGRGAAEALLADWRRARPETEPHTLVVCGGGNNGGDGYVLARRLALLGVNALVFSTRAFSELAGDAATNQRAFAAGGGRCERIETGSLATFQSALERADVVVDALFGTGLARPIDGLEQQVVLAINEARARRVALDLPSGIDADTGSVLGVAVRADLTLTFGAHKPGLLTANGALHAGRVELVDIGVSARSLPSAALSARFLESRDVRAVMRPRALDEHKASAGRVLVLAGSAGKVGAALLVAQGALHAGAGLVTLAGVPAVVDALDRRVLEAMTARLDPNALEASLSRLLEATDVVAIGPGLGFEPEAARIIERAVLAHEGNVVVDADALSHFKDDPGRLAGAKGRLILTPHTGELARLLHTSSKDVDADRFGSLARSVNLTHATVLLKGPHTLVGTNGELPVVGRRGSPALATGGAGDVLTGVIAALACQLEPFAAAYSGAFLHALAGEMWAADVGADRGLLAHEIAAWIPRALADVQRGGQPAHDAAPCD